MRYGYDTMQKVEKQLKLNNLFILNYGPDFCLCQKAEKIYGRPKNRKTAFVKLNATSEKLNLKASCTQQSAKMPQIFVKALQDFEGKWHFPPGATLDD